MKEIIPGIYTFTGLFVGRVYAIEGSDGLTLVDCGLSLAPPRIIKQLKAAGYAPGDVKRILITHAHPDHVGGLPELQRLTGASVVCGALERPVVEGEVAVGMISPYKELLEAQRFHTPPVKFPPTHVDRTVSEGDHIEEALGGLQVLHTPGHALGHVTYWQPERRIAIVGDVLMNLRGLTLPFAFVTPDMDADKRSIRRVARLEPEIVLFGHGKPLLKDAARKLRHFSDKVIRP